MGGLPPFAEWASVWFLEASTISLMFLSALLGFHWRTPSSCHLNCGVCETYVESYWNFFLHCHICAGFAATLQSRLTRFDLVEEIILVVCLCDLESIISQVLMII